METIAARMRAHHQHCDDAFAAAEDAAQASNWWECGLELERFHGALESHFEIEERIIFPAFEQRTGMVSGPTKVMRVEHGQMRGLVAQMQQALLAQDADSFSGAAQTLLIMMQQHNMKEENILYPMCDQALAGDTVVHEALAQALAAA